MSINLGQLLITNMLSNNTAGGNIGTSNNTNSSTSFDSTLSSLLSSNTNSSSSSDILLSSLLGNTSNNSLSSLFGNNSDSNGLFGSSMDMAMYSLLNATSRVSKYNSSSTINNITTTNTNNNSCSHCCKHKEGTSSNNLNSVTQSTVNDIESVSSENIDRVENISNTNSSNDNLATKAVDLAKSFIGTPYVWGANGPNSFDCSGFTKYIYKQVYGKDLPRVSYEQAKFGTEVNKEDLQPGDLVFFDTMNKNRVSHVGIYIGEGKFIHAANSKKGVIESDLNSNYYTKTYRGARRP